ncbi:MAG: type II toxin-antitoxin system PemK/MazF family toxin [bacterium]
MQKDFDKWNESKKVIHHKNEDKFYHEREVWWCSLGINIGFEQDGKGEEFSRPILIIKGFSKNVFLCVPLTTKLKQGKFYQDIDLGDKIIRKVILSQIRLIDSKRLENKICTIDELQFQTIKQKITRLIG